MRKFKMWSSSAALLLGLQLQAQAPDWNTLGNVITGGEWFGANTGSSIALSFETRINRPMNWITDHDMRMRLSATLTGM